MSAGKYIRLPSASPFGQKRRASVLVDDEHARTALDVVGVEEPAAHERRAHRLEVAVADADTCPGEISDSPGCIW